MTLSFEAFLSRLRAASDPAPPARYGSYRSYLTLWESVERACAGTDAVLELFGRSTGGEPMWAVRLDGGVRPRLRVLYLANLHAQEFIGVEALLATLALAVKRRSEGDPALDGVEFTFVPTANPDGYRRVALELAAGGVRFRRKNLRGVDLNRNFAEGWSRATPLARLLPFVYEPGAAPLSEAETRSLDALFARRFDRAVSFHSFGGWIFWPWASRHESTVDDHRFAAIAAQMQKRMAHPYRTAQLGRWARWWKAGGAEIDHLYGKYRTLAFLVEVSRGGWRADRPSSWLDPFALFNPEDVAREAGDAALAAIALAETSLLGSGE